MSFLQQSWDLPLVLLSYLYGVLSSLITLQLLFQTRYAERKLAVGFWVLMASCSMAATIWAIHFIGMQALHLSDENGGVTHAHYGPGLTVLSIFCAWVGCFISFLIINLHRFFPVLRVKYSLVISPDWTYLSLLGCLKRLKIASGFHSNKSLTKPSDVPVSSSSSSIRNDTEEAKKIEEMMQNRDFLQRLRESKSSSSKLKKRQEASNQNDINSKSRIYEPSRSNRLGKHKVDRRVSVASSIASGGSWLDSTTTESSSNEEHSILNVMENIRKIQEEIDERQRSITHLPHLFQLLLGAFFLSVGVILMHYLGILAMQSTLNLFFSWWMIVISCFLAALVAFAALWIFSVMRQEYMQTISSFVMSLAVCLMHYTSMLEIDYTRREDISSSHYAEEPLLNFTSVMLFVVCTLLMSLIVLLVSVSNQRRRLDKASVLAKHHASTQSLLSNIMPSAVMNRLLHGDLVIIEEYASASVCFMDLVKFTRLSRIDGMDSVSLLGLLNRIFIMIDRLILASPCEKVKLLGDSCMVVSGLPNEDPKHVQHMLSLLVSIIDALEWFNDTHGEELESRGIPPIQMRYGVATGPMSAGIVGLYKSQWDVYGWSVNYSARLESTGKPGVIHCNEATLKKAPLKHFDVEEQETSLKGFGCETTYLLTPKNFSSEEVRKIVVSPAAEEKKRTPQPGDFSEI